jgi:YHS domain-containing protein
MTNKRRKGEFIMPAHRLRAIFTAMALALVIAPSTVVSAATWQGAKGDQPAVSGNDPVAYFTAGKPTPGRADLTFVHEGATFRFSSPENRAAFIANPDKYAPQFGGYCAWAASQGRLAGPDPSIWRIVDGKLYLNCSKDAEAKWLTDVPGNIQKAEMFWDTQVEGAEP